MTEAEREHQWNRDWLLVEMAEAVERMLELARHAYPTESMLTLGATQQQGRLEAARERFVGSLEKH
ncbi:hypothetical protein [Methylobacterium sp. R2-1]|uniref:hypothetical protein n=1 Tax=Methylobacterium sp. R2-1 TaxID=2587064 RepID=UPI001611A52D|nr:hypothetical protein [Methylobacterium sp. R2-1]MBB2961132.1 hypothetical protein [Methylobacterium sp. R2-1]